jgi:hypothetical protein
MKRFDDDVAQRLLDEYLEHIEKIRNDSSPQSERPNVVVFDVMRSSRLVRPAAEPEVRQATST